MRTTRTVICSPNQEGVLVPNPSGTIIVTLVKTPGQFKEPPTGTVIWCNKVQAFLTFDITGQVVIGINITDMGLNTHITQASVENVIQFI